MSHVTKNEVGVVKERPGVAVLTFGQYQHAPVSKIILPTTYVGRGKLMFSVVFVCLSAGAKGIPGQVGKELPLLTSPLQVSYIGIPCQADRIY